MKIILALLLLSSCNFEISSEKPTLKPGDCILRFYDNGTYGSHVLKINQVFDKGYLLQYTIRTYDHRPKESVEVLEVKKLYRGKELVNKEYKPIDCAAQDVDLETVQL